MLAFPTIHGSGDGDMNSAVYANDSVILARGNFSSDLAYFANYKRPIVQASQVAVTRPLASLKVTWIVVVVVVVIFPLF